MPKNEQSPAPDVDPEITDLGDQGPAPEAPVEPEEPPAPPEDEAPPAPPEPEEPPATDAPEEESAEPSEGFVHTAYSSENVQDIP